MTISPSFSQSCISAYFWSYVSKSTNRNLTCMFIRMVCKHMLFVTQPCNLAPHILIRAFMRVSNTYLNQSYNHQVKRDRILLAELRFYFMVNSFLRAVDRYRHGIYIGPSHVNRSCRFLTFAFARGRYLSDK